MSEDEMRKRMMVISLGLHRGYKIVSRSGFVRYYTPVYLTQLPNKTPLLRLLDIALSPTLLGCEWSLVLSKDMNNHTLAVSDGPSMVSYSATAPLESLTGGLIHEHGPSGHAVSFVDALDIEDDWPVPLWVNPVAISLLRNLAGVFRIEMFNRMAWLIDSKYDTHLSTTRNGALCGARTQSTVDINHVTCPVCVELYEKRNGQ